MIDSELYLVITFADKKYTIVSIPTDETDRFIEIPGDGNQYCYLDDIVRLSAQKLIPHKEVSDCYSIKISRDAELYLEDDYSNDELVEKYINL